ncbi:CHAT domain-containing protein [Streptomyces sp. NPDC059063]|uniref:CHAT domain-containing protein n=1 Tax=unclassified Streptomyces TaxID=2593676 RepID=UPI0036BB9284
MTTATLTLLNDHEGEYEDDQYYQRARARHVHGPLGSSPLLRETVDVLQQWVARYDENCSRPELVLLGRCLYAVAFGEPSKHAGDGSAPLLDAFEESYADHRRRYRDRPLRLRLVIEPQAEKLSKYPWEFLYKREGTQGFFIAGQRTELVLTRYVPPVGASDAEQWRDGDDRLRILVVLSLAQSPRLGTVSADDLVKDIIALRSDSIEVDEPLLTPTRGELRKAVSARHPHIIHLVGHGDSELGIALRKEDKDIRDEELLADALRSRGKHVPAVDPTDWVDRETISGILREDEGGGRRTLGRLVFLHACKGATPEESRTSLRAYESVATLLAGSPGIAGVIAMQYPISNGDAQMFARHFYRKLRNGEFIDQAVSSARRQLGHADQRGGRAAWADRVFATPVVYLSDEDPLCQALPRHLADPSATCPNEACRAPVDMNGNVCPSCRTVFMACRRPGGCPGLVVAHPEAHCALCDYRLAQTGGSPAGRTGRADRPAGGSGLRRTAPPPRRGTRPEDTGDASRADVWE